MVEQENTFATEDMNNFHWHMPNGGYRPFSEGDGAVSENSIRGVITRRIKEFGYLFDQPEETWPEDKLALFKELKANLAIQKAIDEILTSDEVLKQFWSDHQNDFKYGGREAVREQVLRPIYVRLRQSFSYSDLTG